jgi:hypothetical protein
MPLELLNAAVGVSFWSIVALSGMFLAGDYAVSRRRSRNR